MQYIICTHRKHPTESICECRINTALSSQYINCNFSFVFFCDCLWTCQMSTPLRRQNPMCKCDFCFSFETRQTLFYKYICLYVSVCVFLCFPQSRINRKCSLWYFLCIYVCSQELSSLCIAKICGRVEKCLKQFI